MTDAARSSKRVSERRRQQNVRAQKNYRERQKRHMKVLEDLLTSRALQPEPGSTQQTNDHGSFSDSTSQHSSGHASESTNVTTAAASSDVANHSSRAQQISAIEVVSRLMGQIDDLDEHMRARIESGETTVQDILKAGLDALQLQQRAPIPHMDRSNEGTLYPAVRTDRILVPQNRLQVHPVAVPNIYANHLRIKQWSTVAAIRANAEQLGITFDEVIDEETESPFYKGPITKETAEMVVSTRFRDMTPQLRPVAAQIQHSHHPYIDVFPCPTFRQRVTELISMEPPMIDEDDLCLDLEKEGLICWGSQSGEGHAPTGSGAPWDIRSWEAQPWFLKKWWFLVGGAEGTLFQQSRWWHELRGDRLPNPW